MPIYEYRCAECEEAFELLVRSAKKQAVPTCPVCGSAKVQKSISLFGIGGSAKSGEMGVASCGPGPV
jgi:putative FmdB family regulatory protein